MTMRLIIDSPSNDADALIRETRTTHCGRIEQVSSIHNCTSLHEIADLLEVQPAELVPLCRDYKHRGASARSVGVLCNFEAITGADERRVVGDDLRIKFAQTPC